MIKNIKKDWKKKFIEESQKKGDDKLEDIKLAAQPDQECEDMKSENKENIEQQTKLMGTKKRKREALADLPITQERSDAFSLALTLPEESSDNKPLKLRRIDTDSSKDDQSPKSEASPRLEISEVDDGKEQSHQDSPKESQSAPNSKGLCFVPCVPGFKTTSNMSFSVKPRDNKEMPQKMVQLKCFFQFGEQNAKLNYN